MVSGGRGNEESLYPDERVAVVALTNLDASDASTQIAAKVFTSNANAYFSPAALKDFASSLGSLGTVQEFTQQAQSLRGGMTLRRFRVKLPQKTLRVWTFTMPDGKLEQYMVAPAE